MSDDEEPDKLKFTTELATTTEIIPPGGDPPQVGDVHLLTAPTGARLKFRVTEVEDGTIATLYCGKLAARLALRDDGSWWWNNCMMNSEAIHKLKFD